MRMNSGGVQTIDVDGILFAFSEGWDVEKFDDWPQFRKLSGKYAIQGCDIVAFDGDVLWLLEVKDYTYPGAKLPANLPVIVGKKGAGTLAVLHALAKHEHPSAQQVFASRCLRAKQINIALHIELKDGGEKLKYINSSLSNLRQEIRRVRREFGLKGFAVTSYHLPLDKGVPWRARRNPQHRDIHVDR